MSKRFVLLLCLLAFGAGWMTGGTVESQKRKGRPVLTAIVKLAKAALWLAAFAEPPPEEPVEHRSVMIDETGYARINHARGW